MSTASAPDPRANRPATITAPRAPTAITPTPFPLVATIAPVVVSVVLFAVTRSPFALLFAVLGPVIAIASLVDGSLHRRRRRRREWRRFEKEAEEALRALDAAHGVELDERLRRHPSTAELVASARDPGIWPHGEAGVEVRLGLGTVGSELRLDRAAEPDHDQRVDAVVSALVSRAHRLENAPVCIDAREGVGFCGSPVAAGAAARAFVLQLARVVDPAGWSLRRSSAASWRWLDDLPHARAPDAGADAEAAMRWPRSEIVEFVPGLPIRSPPGQRYGDQGSAPVRIAVALTLDELPRWCRVVIRVDAAGTGRIAAIAHAASDDPVRCDLATASESSSYARALRSLAETEGRVSRTLLPDRVEFAELDHAVARALDGGDDVVGLAVELGSAGSAPWRVDLVADGPHAVVGGTTGSGKSELLVTWVLALAALHPPERVTFLLVDFKGGSAFDGLSRLPHRVGTITDLDPASARRALDSLRAELRFREAALARAGARSIDDPRAAATLPRLVIVVDEFAALATGFPELHALFADLAARGRSLGIHLVLCTQRPAPSLRDAILANCTLRVSLRVNDSGDSAAVIGTGAAALLPRQPPGRALVSIAGAEPRAVQIAVAGERDIAEVARRWPPRSVRRPWCEPLPALIPADELPGTDELARSDDLARSEEGARPGGSDPAGASAPGGPAPAQPLGDAVVFGRVDLPHEQSQPPAVWRPDRDGPLLVLGAHGSGKSTALATIARDVRAVVVPRDVEGAWDLVSEMVLRVENASPTGGHPILFFDDIDSLLAQFGRDHELEFAGLLSRLIRDGPRAGLVSVLSASGPPSMLHAGIEARLILRMPSRQEHLMAGGSSSDFDEKLTPGAGRWRGDLMQVGWMPLPIRPPASAAPRLSLPPGRATALISSRPGALRTRWAGTVASGRLRLLDLTELPRGSADAQLLVADRAHHLVLLGDPEAWQTSPMLALVPGRLPMVFDGCAAADFRAVTRTRRLPPALDAGRRHGWLLNPDDALSRVALPESGP